MNYFYENAILKKNYYEFQKMLMHTNYVLEFQKIITIKKIKK